MSALPLATKHIERTGSQRWKLAAVSVCGRRLTMEDEDLLCSSSLFGASSACAAGVFDGHYGSAASAFLKQNLLDGLLDRKEQRVPSAAEIKDRLLSLDKKFLAGPNAAQGCTAVFAFMEAADEKNARARVAHVGDARALLLRSSGDFTCLTADHKPTKPEEAQRIKKAGGSVEGNRVDGNLAVSRAIGDSTFKSNKSLSADEQMVIAVPDVVDVACEAGDALLLACDGAFERLTNEQVAACLHQGLQDSPNDPADALCNLLDLCLTNGTGDNISAVLVQFVDGSRFGVGGGSPAHELRAAPFFDRKPSPESRKRFEADLNRTGAPINEQQRVFLQTLQLDIECAQNAREQAKAKLDVDIAGMKKLVRSGDAQLDRLLESAVPTPMARNTCHLLVSAALQQLSLHIGACSKLVVNSSSDPVAAPLLVTSTAAKAAVVALLDVHRAGDAIVRQSDSEFVTLSTLLAELAKRLEETDKPAETLPAACASAHNALLAAREGKTDMPVQSADAAFAVFPPVTSASEMTDREVVVATLGSAACIIGRARKADSSGDSKKSDSSAFTAEILPKAKPTAAQGKVKPTREAGKKPRAQAVAVTAGFGAAGDHACEPSIAARRVSPADFVLLCSHALIPSQMAASSLVEQVGQLLSEHSDLAEIASIVCERRLDRDPQSNTLARFFGSLAIVRCADVGNANNVTAPQRIRLCPKPATANNFFSEGELTSIAQWSARLMLPASATGADRGEGKADVKTSANANANAIADAALSACRAVDAKTLDSRIAQLKLDTANKLRDLEELEHSLQTVCEEIKAKSAMTPAG